MRSRLGEMANRACRGPVGSFVRIARHRVSGGLSRERALAGQHLVEHGAEGEHVGALIDLLSAYLLWRHVAEVPEDHARH